MGEGDIAAVKELLDLPLPPINHHPLGDAQVARPGAGRPGRFAGLLWPGNRHGHPVATPISPRPRQLGPRVSRRPHHRTRPADSPTKIVAAALDIVRDEGGVTYTSGCPTHP